MRALIIFNLFFLSVGCSTAPISIQSDNVIEKIAELRPGTSTRNDVASLLGSPDIETPIDNTELQLWYGVRTSHGINVPQVIVGLDPTSQKMQWIWYNNFDEKLNISLINRLYPTAKFEAKLEDQSRHPCYFTNDKQYVERNLGVTYYLRSHGDVQYISWGIPSSAHYKTAINIVTSKEN